MHLTAVFGPGISFVVWKSSRTFKMDGWCKKYQENEVSQRTPKRTMGTPNPKWKDAVENDIRKMGIVNYIEVVRDRDG